MRTVAVPIPDKSHGIRVWDQLPESSEVPKNKEPYDFVCVLKHIDDSTCEVTHAMGDLSNEVSIAIGQKAFDLGYEKLLFCRSSGGPASRWATFLRSEDGLDYYEVDLKRTMDYYLKRLLHG